MRTLFTVLGLAASLAACGDDENKNPAVDASVPVDAPMVAADVTLSTAGTLGARLVDKNGKSLYFFVNDVAGANTSSCKDTCPTNWTAFDVQAPKLGEGLTAADFGRLDLGSGKFHATWKGRPLYYFANDTAAAPTAGEGVGGRWFVARAYNLFFAANVDATPQGAAKGTPFLTNGGGRTLYVFKNDTRGTATTPPATACTAEPCITNWPIWEKPAALTNVVLPSKIPAADVTYDVTVGDATRSQFVYKGWPLYFYKDDTASGQVAGDAITNWDTANIAWDGAFVAP